MRVKYLPTPKSVRSGVLLGFGILIMITAVIVGGAVYSLTQYQDASAEMQKRAQLSSELQTAEANGKPAQSAEIVAKRIEGGVQKFLKEVSLFNQSFVKNDKQTVEQMLKAANTSVKSFTLFVVGEGIEKKVDDFAAEVAAQVAAAKGAA